MSGISDLVSKVSVRFSDQLRKYCSPLFQCFNLNYLYCHKVSDSGHVSFLGTNPGWVEYFCERQFHIRNPYHRNSEQFRDCFVLLENVESFPFQEIMVSARERFNFYFNLQIMNRTKDGIETFGFAAPIDNKMHTAALLNELSLLRFFIKKFKSENTLIFSRLEEYQIDLSTLLGKDFYVKELPAVPQLSERSIFLQKMKIPCDIRLTKQEKNILKLSLEGHSAGAISTHIFRSKRTVEHHMERLKNKLSCNSKTELLQKARELEQIGYLL